MKRIKNFINNLIFKYFKEPRQKREALVEQKLALANIESNFEATHHTNISEVKRLMNFKLGVESNPKFEYWNGKLIEARQTNEYPHSPVFYEPEICEIHNENLDSPFLSDYNTVLERDNLISSNLIRKQVIKANLVEKEKMAKQQALKAEADSYAKITKAMREASTTPPIDEVELKMLKTTMDKIKNR